LTGESAGTKRLCRDPDSSPAQPHSIIQGIVIIQDIVETALKWNQAADAVEVTSIPFHFPANQRGPAIEPELPQVLGGLSGFSKFGQDD
jgi:hypothetical protein